MKNLTALFFILISVLCIALTACSNVDTFTQEFYSSSETEIEKITILTTDREIEFSTSEDNQIQIDYYNSEKEYLDIKITENKELTINLILNKDFADYFGTKPPIEYRKILIKVPNKLFLSISATTTNENIKFDTTAIGENISLNTNGGNIILDKINVNKAINLTAKNGNITGTIVGSWDDFSIYCKIKKGECNLPTFKESGVKSLIADCNNGDIDINFIANS